MKKKEIKILIYIVLIVAIALVGYKIYVKYQADNASSAVKVKIVHGDTVVKVFDPSVDAVYHVEGDYGGLDVEVKDGKWHVTNEECPNHICSQTGWVSEEDFLPIVCLPNNVSVMIAESN